MGRVTAETGMMTAVNQNDWGYQKLEKARDRLSLEPSKEGFWISELWPPEL